METILLEGVPITLDSTPLYLNIGEGDHKTQNEFENLYLNENISKQFQINSRENLLSIEVIIGQDLDTPEGTHRTQYLEDSINFNDILSKSSNIQRNFFDSKNITHSLPIFQTSSQLSSEINFLVLTSEGPLINELGIRYAIFLGTDPSLFEAPLFKGITNTNSEGRLIIDTPGIVPNTMGYIVASKNTGMEFNGIGLHGPIEFKEK